MAQKDLDTFPRVRVYQTPKETEVSNPRVFWGAEFEFLGIILRF